jgi:hypothetical protein
MRSTAEWEAALEGAHLDGVTLNWLDNGRDPVTGQDLGVRIVYYDGGHTGGEINLPSGGLICESVPGEIAPLFALAPEAVAEVVRLRRELELRVRIWQKVAEKLKNRGDEDGASQARHTVAVVTRILEDTHE